MINYHTADYLKINRIMTKRNEIAAAIIKAQSRDLSPTQYLGFAKFFYDKFLDHLVSNSQPIVRPKGKLSKKDFEV